MPHILNSLTVLPDRWESWLHRCRIEPKPLKFRLGKLLNILDLQKLLENGKFGHKTYNKQHRAERKRCNYSRGKWF